MCPAYVQCEAMRDTQSYGNTRLLPPSPSPSTAPPPRTPSLPMDLPYWCHTSLLLAGLAGRKRIRESLLSQLSVHFQASSANIYETNAEGELAYTQPGPLGQVVQLSDDTQDSGWLSKGRAHLSRCARSILQHVLNHNRTITPTNLQMDQLPGSAMTPFRWDVVFVRRSPPALLQFQCAADPPLPLHPGRVAPTCMCPRTQPRYGCTP